MNEPQNLFPNSLYITILFYLSKPIKDNLGSVWIGLKMTESHVAFSSFFFFLTREQCRGQKTLFM